MSSDGPGVVNEDDGSRSSKTSAVPVALEAFRWPFREACHSSDRGPLAEADAIRNSTFFDAMLCDGDGKGGNEVMTLIVMLRTATFPHGSPESKI